MHVPWLQLFLRDNMSKLRAAASRGFSRPFPSWCGTVGCVAGAVVCVSWQQQRPLQMSQGSRQHTFVETDSVRYVFQPLEALYVLIVTNKGSNIIEDLETLQLLSRIVPEYCRYLDEQGILVRMTNGHPRRVV